MKLTGLEEKLLPTSGNDEPAEAEKMPTLKKVLRMVIGGSKAKSADTARIIAKFILKLQGDTKEVELGEGELKALSELVESNQVSLTAHIQGQLLNKLDDAKGK